MKIKTAVCLLPLLALAGCGENNSAPLCNGTDNLASSMTEWLNEAMAKEDSGAKKYPVKVVKLIQPFQFSEQGDFPTDRF